MEGGFLKHGLWWPNGIKPTAPDHAVRHCVDALPACKRAAGFGCAIQAGGNVGVWPRIMASWFTVVHTYEPEAESYRFLVENTRDCPNVETHMKALGAEPGRCSVKRRSLGSHHLVEGETVDVVTIDQEFATTTPKLVRLIQLDVEGYELEVLRGAEATLLTHQPVVQVEMRNLGARFGSSDGDVQKFLQALGYRNSQRVGADVVFWVD